MAKRVSRTESKVRRIGISTGGGDAPGLNAVIRAVVLAAHQRGWETVGIRDGYNGLMLPERFPQGGLIPLGPQEVRGITHIGGTILGTTNRGNPMRYPTQNAAGEWEEVDRRDELIERFAEAGIDALVAIGGDGSLEIAHGLADRGLPVIGVPKTIDNDLIGTDATFGFDSAVDFATECIDRLHSTAESHQRIMVMEVMGRYAGWIALHAGVAGTADVILIPEIPYDIEVVAADIRLRYENDARFAIVAIAEGAKPIGGDVSVVRRELGRAELLGGVGEKVAAQLGELTGFETRTVVLGHLLRGGTPSASDRLLSLRLGAAAVRGIAEGRSNVMVALNAAEMGYVPLDEVAGRMRGVPLDSDILKTANDVGICLGRQVSRV